MFKPYMVRVICRKNGDVIELSGFGRDEDDYVWARTAKRLISRRFGFVPEYVKNIDLELIDITNMHDDLGTSDEVRENFRLNVRTVPCYVYTCELPDNG